MRVCLAAALSSQLGNKNLEALNSDYFQGQSYQTLGALSGKETAGATGSAECRGDLGGLIDPDLLCIFKETLLPTLVSPLVTAAK